MHRKQLLPVAFLIVAIAIFWLAQPTLGGQAAIPTSAILSGRVYLQTRPNHAGATVCVGSACVTSNANGSFTLANVPIGSQSITASCPGFLSAQAVLNVSAGEVYTLADVTLLGGDIVANAKVDIFDLVTLGRSYGECPSDDPPSDINGDGCINVLDLVVVGANYGQAGPIPWGLETNPTPYPAPTHSPTVSPYPPPS